MTNLNSIFRAGFVRRWHSNPDLCHTVDRIDGHSARVARIILALHPSPSVALIRAALTHDDGESVTGDMSAVCKHGNPQLAEMLAEAEYAARRALWGPPQYMPQCDRNWLKFADRLDAYMWAAHHAPHIMDRDDWPELLAWINETADVLGVDMKEMGIC